jgi:hypothetical protein
MTPRWAAWCVAVLAVASAFVLLVQLRLTLPDGVESSALRWSKRTQPERPLPGNEVQTGSVTGDALHVAESDRSWTAFCRASANCLSARCYAPWALQRSEGGCEPSPYFAADRSAKASNRRSEPRAAPAALVRGSIDSLQCVHRAAVAAVAENGEAYADATADTSNSTFVFTRAGRYPPSSDCRESCEGRRFRTFQRRTSWMFERTYEWGGDCQRPTDGAASARMTASHDPRTGLYTIRNFCVSPLGQVAGFEPNIEAYGGTDEIYFFTRGKNFEVPQWLRERTTSLPQPPPCFLHTNIVVFPVGGNDRNPGHMLYRAGSMLRVIETAFGEAARDQRRNVTVMYVQVGALHTRGSRLVNPVGMFYDLFGTSHFAIVDAASGELSDARERLFPRGAGAGLSHLACFRSAVLWQDSLESAWLRGNGVASASVPGLQTSFRLFGPRSPRDVATVALVNERLRLCAGLPPRRRRASADRPHVLLAIRSVSRRFSLQPFLIDVVGRHVRAALNGTMEVVEHLELNLPEIIATYSGADILVGIYGAALTWSLFMPPGAAVVQFGHFWFRDADGATGINTAPQSDFGGAAVAAEHAHLLFADDDERLARYPLSWRAIRTFDAMIGPRLATFALDRAACTLRAGVERCHYANADLQRLTSEVIDDEDGAVLARCAAMRIPEPVANGEAPADHRGYARARLPLLARFARVISRALRHLRWSEPGRWHTTRLLFVPGACASRDDIALVLAALRCALQRIDDGHVAEIVAQQDERTSCSNASWSDARSAEASALRRCAFPCAADAPFDLVLVDDDDGGQVHGARTSVSELFDAVAHPVTGVVLVFSLGRGDVRVARGSLKSSPVAAAREATQLAARLEHRWRQCAASSGLAAVVIAARANDTALVARQLASLDECFAHVAVAVDDAATGDIVATLLAPLRDALSGGGMRRRFMVARGNSSSSAIAAAFNRLAQIMAPGETARGGSVLLLRACPVVERGFLRAFVIPVIDKYCALRSSARTDNCDRRNVSSVTLVLGPRNPMQIFPAGAITSVALDQSDVVVHAPGGPYLEEPPLVWPRSRSLGSMTRRFASDFSQLRWPDTC